MTIGDLAQKTGVAPSALRYYESTGLMPRAGRLNGRRVYDAGAVTHVQVVAVARELGFTIREIRTLVEDQSSKSITDRWRALAESKLPEMNALIDRATRMKKMLQAGLACGCARIEDCILHGCQPQSPPALLQIRRTTPRES